jgi:hypothetical protein
LRKVDIFSMSYIGIADVLFPAALVAGGHTDCLLLPAAGDTLDPHPPGVLRRELALQDYEVPSGMLTLFLKQVNDYATYYTKKYL